MDIEEARREMKKREAWALTIIAICMILLLAMYIVYNQVAPVRPAPDGTAATATYGAEQFATWVAAQTPSK